MTSRAKELTSEPLEAPRHSVNMQAPFYTGTRTCSLLSNMPWLGQWDQTDIGAGPSITGTLRCSDKHR